MKYIKAEYFAHTPRDPWRWRAAGGQDVEAIVDLVMRNYESDGTKLTDISPVEGSRNLMHAIVNQMYNPKTELVSVCQAREDGTLLAFNWAQRDIRNPWSTEEMCVPKMLSVELGPISRTKTAIVIQAMLQWERWCQVCEIKCINSNSMRRDWQPLMRLHTAMGYDVRGSIAYKRLNVVSLEPETSRIILP